ncbi:hypothetical protein C3B44_01235 [Corynebacterium yudongzhengii]|uniref:Uncharacterized protein n=1 Tax=Corynebacterium yudongzhengii TaxID=2080740 RepID=A0A2U1T4R1_9CORY|nr:hypothetical protein [Corynebacterium yudongzhengii]AWB81132.1 hypothetical protein C3B44_01235 [Corynebacterium yudongzhengii]PWC00990.1 hypothetical protein DF222_09930 [Corynebacterium yudongzhengii]
MSSHAAAVEHNENLHTEGYPTYHTGNAEDAYIEGYDPVSLSAPHSSLLKTSTWLGMGLVMASLAGFGTLLFGLAQFFWGTGTADHSPVTLMVIGGVIGVVLLVVGLVLAAVVGRKDYKAYTKRTGRYN